MPRLSFQVIIIRMSSTFIEGVLHIFNGVRPCRCHEGEVRGNGDNIKQGNVLPYLVSNVVEVSMAQLTR